MAVRSLEAEEVDHPVANAPSSHSAALLAGSTMAAAEKSTTGSRQ